jgi:endonuclease G
MSEHTSFLLKDQRVQHELLNKRSQIGGHPRYRHLREALAQLPEKSTAEEFNRIVDGSPSLEKIVRAVNRPALLVKEDSFEAPIADVWFARLNAARTALERAIRATGRVELREPPSSGHIGTGWLIAPGVVVTNRHVAREFVRRQQDGVVVLRTSWLGRPYRPVVDFREEYRQGAPPLEFEMDRVLFIAADDDAAPDVALLAVKAGQGSLPDPIPLADVTLAPGRPVATIGYPAYDYSEADRTVMVELFHGIFDVKRLSPGEVMVPPMAGQWFFQHDCSTLGGSSGSVLLDLESGGAVGLHFSGTSGMSNYAISGQALAQVLAGVPTAAAPPARLPAVVVKPKAEPGADEEKATPAAYTNRHGYDPNFLLGGTSVQLPGVVAARQGEVAPLVIGPGNELKYCHFSVIVNAARRLPMITGVNIDGTILRRVAGKGHWRIDPRIADEHQIGNEIYKNNNLDKGHMVRRLDPVWGTELEAKMANDDTFHYTNACPQDHTFNDEVWGDLEDHILDSAPEDLRLSVLTGPVLAHDDPTYRGIQIPRSFWKMVAWRKNGLKVAAFLLTQEEYLGNLEFNPYQFGTCQVTLAEVGDLTGLQFGSLLQADVLAAQEAARPRISLKSVDEMRI